MASIPWPRLRRLRQSWIWRSSDAWWVFLGIFLLVGLPYFVEKYLITALQSELQRSAVQWTERFNTKLETEKKGFSRAVLAADEPRTKFPTLSRAWLRGTPEVFAVTLLHQNGEVVESVTRSQEDAPSHAEFIASWKTLNRVLIAHALELQEPAFSALQLVNDEPLVNLIIPSGVTSSTLYVLTLDAKQWINSVNTEEDLLSVEIVPFRVDASEANGRYYINTSAWEGLWSLKFQSRDSLFGLLQTLRPVFFLVTWLIAALFFLYWRNFRLRQKAELELQTKTQMLEKQNRLSLLGEMSAQLAHEINQPLATIANYAVAGKLQLQSVEPSSALTPLFQEILEQSQRAAQVLIAVRAILQPDPLDMGDIDVEQLITKLEPSLRFLCAPHQVTLTVSTTKSLAVRLNSILFEQVIFNLVKNSIQALTESDRPVKRITITSTEVEGRLLIEIEDNGPGIQAENAERIFESLFTTKAEGLGIGLSLCRSVIERFNGKLTLKSNSRLGASFLIDLPITQKKPEVVSP